MLLPASSVNWCGGSIPQQNFSSLNLARTTDTPVNGPSVFSRIVVRLRVPKTIDGSHKVATIGPLDR